MISRKQFRHLISAMLHIDRHIQDKDVVVEELHAQFVKQSSEQDPVVWLRSRFESKKPYPDGIYIRETFTARSFQDVKPG